MADKEIPNFDDLNEKERQKIVQSLIESEQEDNRKPQEGFISETSKVLALFGLPAEAHPHKLRRFPFATVVLILATCFISLYAILAKPELVTQLAFIPAEKDKLGGLALISSFLVHGGFEHLFFNMYFLFIFGVGVEELLGPFVFIFLIAIATFFGNIISGLVDPTSAIPHIGASGGIFGVLVFYLLRYPRRRFTYMFFFRFITVPAYVLLVLYSSLQFLGMIMQASHLTNTDHFAHIGGGVAGLFGWMLYRGYRQMRHPTTDK